MCLCLCNQKRVNDSISGMEREAKKIELEGKKKNDLLERKKKKIRVDDPSEVPTNTIKPIDKVPFNLLVFASGFFTINHRVILLRIYTKTIDN
jgi:hypothetical protein